jgi:predicted amidohydrolase
MSHPQLKNYLSAILEASRKTDALIVPGTFEWLEGRYHHTCYAIKNGNVVFARNKNDKPSSPLDFLGQKVGIQICHENHTPTPFPNGLDLLLVVSAGITIPKLDSVRVGGYALTVDGHNKAYTLMKNAGDGIIVKSNF